MPACLGPTIPLGLVVVGRLWPSDDDDDVLYLVPRAVVLDVGCCPSVAERKLDAGGGGAGQLPHFAHGSTQLGNKR